MEDEKYGIGQVLYLIPPDKIAIVPVRVVSIDIKKTIDNTTVNYHIEDVQGKSGTLGVDTKYRIFTTLDEVSNELYENAMKNIDKIVDAAKTRAIKLQPHISESTVTQQKNEENTEKTEYSGIVNTA